MELYLNLFSRITIVGEDKILLKDVAATANDTLEFSNIVIRKIDFTKHSMFTVDIIDIINAIKKIDKNITIYNIGGSDEVIVEYFTEEKKNNKFLTFLKLVLISIGLFGGAATTIMAFHNETGLPHVFDNFYKIFFGHESKNPAIIDIPYSLGLSIGIIGFFNHVFGKSFTEEPTPMEIEMNKYNLDLNETEKMILDGDDSE